MFRDYFMLGFKNLRKRGVRSWLTLLGVLIGIAAVVSLISLGEGLNAAVLSQIGSVSADVINVQAGGLNSFGPPGSGVVNPLTKDDAKEIEKIKHIEWVLARNIETVRLEHNNILQIGNILSVPNDKIEESYINNDMKAEKGRLLQKGDSGRIFIGYDLTDKDKNGFNKQLETGDSLTIENKNFRIIGVLDRKGSFFLDKTIFMLDSDLDTIKDLGEDADIIVVKVEETKYMEEVKEDIEKLLRKRRDVDKGYEDFEVSTPESTLETVNQILGGVQAFIVLIASASILVGAIGIINTMTTSVLERKREIGIMKAIGARNSDIFYQFFIEAGLLGLVGGIIGIVIGVNIGVVGTFAINNFIGAESSPSLNLFLIIGSLLGSFIIGSVSGIARGIKTQKKKKHNSIMSFKKKKNRKYIK